MLDLHVLRSQNDTQRDDAETWELLRWINAQEHAVPVLVHLRKSWIRPHLRGCGASEPLPPDLSDFFVTDAGFTPPHQMSTARRTDILAGRALADELLDCEPSAELWERAQSLVRLASWDGFISGFDRRVGTREGALWASLLAEPPDLAIYFETALDAERESMRHASAKWAEAPRLLGRPPSRGHTPISSSYQRRLAVLALLDRSLWFSALRACPLRAELEFALRSISERPAELLAALREAPAALDEHGNETGDVAAIMLARRALSYAADVEDAILHRVRLALVGAEREQASEVARSFREAQFAPWLDRVWTTIASRCDGELLSLAIAVERVAGRLRDNQHHPVNECAALAEADLENRVSALWRPRLDAVTNLLETGDLGRHRGPLARWYVFARIAIDDVGDVKAGAELACSRLVELLVKFVGDSNVIGPNSSVSNYAWKIVASVMSQQSDPALVFSDLFDRLWTEREQARLGAFRGIGKTRIRMSPVASHFVLAAGACAVSTLPGTGRISDARSLWSNVFTALVESWLAYPDHSSENRATIKRVFTYGAIAHREAIERDSHCAGLMLELTHAISLAAADELLAMEIAALWIRYGWPAEDVVGLFTDAGLDLDSTSARLLAVPLEWLSERDEITMLRAALAL